MKFTVLALLIPLVQSILQKLAQNLWDGLWEEIVKAVGAAESKWIESGRGEAKKGWAHATVMAYLDSRAKLGWIQRLVVNMFVSKAIDAVVDTFNEEVGKDWETKVSELERELASRIAFIN